MPPIACSSFAFIFSIQDPLHYFLNFPELDSAETQGCAGGCGITLWLMLLTYRVSVFIWKAWIFLHNLSIATNRILHEFTNWKPYIFLIFFSLTFVNILATFSVELFELPILILLRILYCLLLPSYCLCLVMCFDYLVLCTLSLEGNPQKSFSYKHCKTLVMTASGHPVHTSFYLYVYLYIPSLPCPQLFH